MCMWGVSVKVYAIFICLTCEGPGNNGGTCVGKKGLSHLLERTSSDFCFLFEISEMLFKARF